VGLTPRSGLLATAVAFAAGAALSEAKTPAIPDEYMCGCAAAVLVGSAFAPVAPLAFATAGFAAGWLARPGPSPSPVADRARGTVTSMPRRVEGRASFVVASEEGARMEVNAPDLAPGAPLSLGDRVLLAPEAREPLGARNPGGRDRAAVLRAHGVALTASSRIAPARLAPPPPLALVEAARLRFGAEADRVLPPRVAGLVRAIGAGDEAGIDAGTRDAFARSGLAHVLSVSGLHLAVVALGAFRLLRALLLRLGDLPSRIDAGRWSAAATLPIAGLYAVGTGASVPVLRSAVAAGLLLLSVMLRRERDSRGDLALAALAILAVEPGAVQDPSFQLSFASVAGLVALSGPLRRAVPLAPDRSRLAGRALEAALLAACASAAATVATAPLLALHFRRLSTMAIPANVVGLPLAAALTVLAALAYLATAVAPPAGTALLHACRPVAAPFLWLNDLLAAPSWATVGVASPGWAGALGSLVLGAAALRARGPLRAILWGAAAALVLLPGPLRHAAALHRGGLEVVFLSVGQGDAAVLRLPDGSVVLVDGGGDPAGRYDPGARDVAPFLRDMGIRRIAAAFLSHPHPDHLQGMPGVHAELPFRRLFWAGRRGDEGAAAALRRLPAAEVLEDGDVVELAGVRFEVLGPPRGDVRLVENDASLVLRVTHGRTSFLLAGDVEAAAEAALVARGGLASDVVKVPHHGSRTSSGHAFTRSTSPRWAVISLGAGNRYGFPHAESVERWRGAGAEVLRTDAGPVRFLSDGLEVRRVDAAGALDALALWRGR
jgi:competence protein ComEC